MSERIAPDLEELHAYVDGQLSADARERLAARLDADPSARRQADDYAALRDGLQALYGPVAQESVPPRLLRRPQQWQRLLAALAASLALLIVGGIMGAFWERSHSAFPIAATPSVVREAAMAYAVYSPEVRHPVDVPGDQERHLVAWLTKRMRAELRAPQLDQQGFSLVGGRLLATDQGPGALLMYEDAQGRRVILYLGREREGGRDTAFRFAQAEGVSVFYWREDRLSYALAGELDRAGLLAIAEAVYRQFTA